MNEKFNERIQSKLAMEIASKTLTITIFETHIEELQAKSKKDEERIKELEAKVEHEQTLRADLETELLETNELLNESLQLDEVTKED